jgi:hypothetical protein
MKKIIAFLGLMAFSVLMIAAQDPGGTVTEISSTAGDQISQVVTTVFDKTSEAVKDLADALKVPAERVYTVLVKQQVVKAIIWSLITAVFVFVGLALFTSANRSYNKMNALYIKENPGRKPLNFWDDDFLPGPQWIIGITLFCAGIIIFAASLTTMLSGYFNPEYGAIKEIMGLL